MKAFEPLEKLQNDIDKLPLDDQLKLVERVIQKIRHTTHPANNRLNWEELYGLGKGLWKNEDAQKYVNRMRTDRK